MESPCQGQHFRNQNSPGCLESLSLLTTVHSEDRTSPRPFSRLISVVSSKLVNVSQRRMWRGELNLRYSYKWKPPRNWSTPSARLIIREDILLAHFRPSTLISWLEFAWIESPPRRVWRDFLCHKYHVFRLGDCSQQGWYVVAEFHRVAGWKMASQFYRYPKEQDT